MFNHLAIEYAVNEDDYASFAAYSATRSRPGRMRQLIFAAAGLASTAVLLGQEPSQIRLFAVPVLATTLVLLFYSRMVRSWARRRFRDGSFDRWKQPARLEISADGLRCSGAIGEAASPWSAIIDVAAPPSGLYLYYSSLHAIVVPRSAFRSDDAFQSFAGRAIAFRDAAIGRAAS